MQDMILCYENITPINFQQGTLFKFYKISLDKTGQFDIFASIR